MKETYLSRDFRETAAQCFPSQAKELNAFFDARLNVLLAENADASKEKQYHLQRQILPGVAAYETLQRVMPKEEALQTVHGYVEELARTSHKQLAALLHIPGLYRLVPGVFVKSTRSVFGPAAGFDSKELQVGNGIWRVDIAWHTDVLSCAAAFATATTSATPVFIRSSFGIEQKRWGAAMTAATFA